MGSIGSIAKASRPRVRAALLAMLASVLAIAGCGGGDGNSAGQTGAPVAGQPAGGGGPLTFAAAQGIPQLDPHKATFAWEAALTYTLWGHLVEFEEDTGLEPQPGLAERWTVSDDARVYTFTLRPDLKFSTGEPLTAEDVVGSIDRALDPKTQWNQAGVMPKLKSYKATDDSTVRVTLENPSTEVFLSILSRLAIVDVSELEALAGDDPPTSGPFAVGEFVPDDHVTLVRNEHHWGEPAPSEELRIVRAQDNSAAVSSLRSKDLDGLWSVPYQNVGQLESDGFQVLASELPGADIIAFGDINSKPFDDVRARQALIYATDKQKIIDVAYGGKAMISRLNLPVAENNPIYNADLPEYEFDLEKAKALFAEAGVTEGSKLTFWTSSGPNPEWAIWGQILQSDLKTIGIDLQIKTNEVNAWAQGFLPTGKKRFPDYVVSNQYFLPSPSIMGVWAPGVCGCNWDDPDYAAAVQKADSVTDPDERKQLYDEAQRIFHEQAPTLVIGQTSAPMALQPDVTGAWVDSGGSPHLAGAVRGGGGAD